MSPSVPAFLRDRQLRLLLFGGKGGVGKTTCAAAAALQLAAHSADRSFLLVSVDPAHSLLDSLAGLSPPPNLNIQELDAQKCLDSFRERNGKTLERIAAAGTLLDDEDIHQLLSLSLPGLDELMAFLEVSGWVERRAYDCVIVDTAPSGHTLRLLAMPKLIRQWLEMLDALLAKRRYMRKVFSGSANRDALDAFVADWAASIERMESLMRDPARCRFVPVTIAEPVALRETRVVLEQLRGWSIPVSELIVNQLHPSAGCAVCSNASAVEQCQIAPLKGLCEPFSCSLWGIDLLPEEVRGAKALNGFWMHAAPLAETLMAPPSSESFPVDHSTPAPHPADDLKLMLFSGKGGVGKTTLACATALRMAREFPSKRVLLFSSDPGHSISACLEQRIGPAPVVVFGRLHAMEINACAEFQTLKARYASDVEDFLLSISDRFDLTFDRVVLERILDLAPPGLDEVMALTRIADFMAQGCYDLFILDSAATGHLIRMLELPELIDQWLKTFFNLFLKYERVLHMPRFSAQLVDLSKNLKRFRRLLVDPQRTAMYAVAIPTQMAWEETCDLMSGCKRAGIHVAAVLLNLMTPTSGVCPLCSELRRRELAIAGQFRDSFPNQQHTPVYRRPKVTGIARLEELGASLYEARYEEAAVHG